MIIFVSSPRRGDPGGLGVAIDEWNFTSCTFQVTHVEFPGSFSSTPGRSGLIRNFHDCDQSRSDQQDGIDERLDRYLIRIRDLIKEEQTCCFSGLSNYRLHRLTNYWIFKIFYPALSS